MSRSNSALLPLPVSAPVSDSKGSSSPSSSIDHPHHSHHPHRPHPLRSPFHSCTPRLFARARTTNLAVLILASLCALSLLFNLRSFLSSNRLHPQPQSPPPPSSPSHQNHPVAPSYSQFTRLVIVPGHAIYIGSNPNLHDPFDPHEWILEPYQINHPSSSIHAFINHIRTAIKILSTDSSALLVYSGGQTRPGANQTTEAGSYSRLANQMGLHDQLPFGPLQTTTEDFAVDSWTNLIYSVARFKEYTGNYPKQITVIGHSIKAKRFNELHRRALRWPREKFEYIGLDPLNLKDYLTSSPSNNLNDRQELDQLRELERSIIDGERKVYLEFEKDLYGCHLGLIQKRKNRNLFRRFHPYLFSCSEIQGLLDWCPINGIDEYYGSLPWSSTQ